MTIRVSRARIDFGDIRCEQAEMKDYSETVNALGNATGAKAINYILGNVVTATATGNITWSVTNPPVSGKAGSFTLILTNGGAYTQTWPSGTNWPGGTAPALTASGVDVISFFTIDGGTTWVGAVSMLDSK